MAIKTANVVARVEPSVKEQAESILSEMGITASMGINMFYRQIIAERGLPFTPSLQPKHPKALDEMTKEEFDQRMAKGLQQAMTGEGEAADVVFNNLTRELVEGGEQDGNWPD